MRVKLFTFRYSATLGGFDEEPLQDFLRDKEVLAFREHFYAVNEVPHFTCVVTWQDAIVSEAVLTTARDAASSARGAPRSEPGVARARRSSDPAAGLDERDRALFNTLREWRRTKAHAEGVPPFVILTNRQLVDVIVRKPENSTALANVSGIGRAKLERYGAEILTELGKGDEVPAKSPEAEAPAETSA